MAVIEFQTDKPTEEDFSKPDLATWLPDKKPAPEPANEFFRNADYTKWLAALGGGDVFKGHFLLNMLAMRMEHARDKHPVFAKDAYHAHTVIFEELDELACAIANESEGRQLDEALDVAVTALRFYNGEYLHK